MPKHILSADIGGTNCRFAHFTLEKDRLELHSEIWLKTANIPTTDILLEACTEHIGRHPHDADVLIIGVAGPISNDKKAKLTNAPLEIDLTEAERRYGIKRCRIINDFMAEAYACLTGITNMAQQILPTLEASPDPSQKTLSSCVHVDKKAPIAVIGAGTGLGTASLVRESCGSWMAIPAEGGHTTFPFVGQEEIAFQAFASKEMGYPYVRGDDVLTGRGLSLLHHFLHGEKLDAREVAAQVLQEESDTLHWYARLYARMCRNWVLTTLCRGGLYITGGIAAKNPHVVACDAFREEFYNTPHFLDLLKSIPVFLNTNKSSGLWGTAWLGARMLQEAEE